MKAYKNHSIFKDIIQFFDEDGQEWKIQDGYVFMLIEGAWIFQGTSSYKKGESLRKRMKRYWSNQY